MRPGERKSRNTGRALTHWEVDEGGHLFLVVFGGCHSGEISPPPPPVIARAVFAEIWNVPEGGTRSYFFLQ